MIARKKSEGVKKKLIAFCLEMLRYVHINAVLYYFLLIIEAIQMFSHVYNCFNDYTKSAYSVIETFSTVSTYFRVYSSF